ncbi:ABC transporter permease [Clostridium estertheticum]|uniref:FtsX-like permease family protein n=1 Tax=Clostridium estertheticum TaxID=238834 RepID=UPI001CF4D50B|nr:ABC transporter permease [Clostridium estertheticum]MCB2307624.1 ABC transporter permease [Clostridium estertheticum]MCB2346749.1 ABC transporter permease [Clostridium estertheticum]MCB2351114.1 ABC transporter permease [Clostridium estertheticum]WAG46671.1 ABC transporter permease [Clostridium estertheticum]
MNSSFYFKFAKTNLKKNSKTYLPYILACISAIIMFYTMDCIVLNEGLDKIRHADTLKMILKFAVKVIGLFSIVFLFYTNSFLIKRRKKEIGLYNVLGMEKKHIAKVLSIETLIIAVISLVLGILGGIIVGKLMFLILINLTKLDITISSSFSISVPAIIQTIELFSIIFAAILIGNLLQVKLTNPIELLKGGQKGEKEPKTSWILAISGVIELAVGYGLAINLESPLKAFTTFFIAVILVIVGTYSTFTAGSIAFLKMLKKNKKFFYKTKNFVSVSGMIYRMKQNAVGLANICILSTAVLLTISTTVALYAGQESSLKIAYPLDVSISIGNATALGKDRVANMIKEEAHKSHVTLNNQVEFDDKELMTLQDKNSFKTAKADVPDVSDIKSIHLYTLEAYNKMEGKAVALKDNEVLIFSVGKEFNYDSIVISGKKFKVKEKLNKIKIANKNKNNLIDEYRIIVKDMNSLKDTYEEKNANELINVTHRIAFDIDGNKEDTIKFCDSLKSHINDMKNSSFQSIYTAREEFYIDNGGFIFIGCFLGLLFTMGIVLIIYYKQISEGYDDGERFKIMQKVGMSKKQVKNTINKQILMVFFLPLAVAAIHIAVAFNVVSKILSLFGPFSTSTLILAISGTVVIFAVLYAVVYGLTAKTYYKIVQQEN